MGAYLLLSAVLGGLKLPSRVLLTVWTGRARAHALKRGAFGLLHCGTFEKDTQLPMGLPSL
jgi:hypothetical protein